MHPTTAGEGGVPFEEGSRPSTSAAELWQSSAAPSWEPAGAGGVRDPIEPVPLEVRVLPWLPQGPFGGGAGGGGAVRSEKQPVHIPPPL